MRNNVEQDLYTQPVLSELKEQENEAITLERVVVETLPTFTQRNGVYSWDCQVYAEPNIFEQERNQRYQLHARTYANDAKKKRLRPGDIITLTGFPILRRSKLPEAVNNLFIT